VPASILNSMPSYNLATLPESQAMPGQVDASHSSATPACRCCGSSSTEALWPCLHEFIMRRCRACGVGFLSPLKAVEYTEQSYAPFITPPDLPWILRPFVRDGRSFSSEWRYRKQVRAISRLAPQPLGSRLKLLDVGCGTGEFIRIAVETGVEAWGVEASPYAVQHCNRHHPYPVVLMERLSDFPVDFDVVTLWHVLEHTGNPAAFLENAVAHLRVGGLAVIEVPNWKAWPSRFWKARWRHIRRDHLFYFTPSVLCDLLLRTGLRPVRVCYTGSWGMTPYLNKACRWSGEVIKHWPPLWPIKVGYLNFLSATRLGDFIRVYAIRTTQDGRQ